MNKETLRMQFLSGVITESQYKQKLEEIGMFNDPVGYKKSELSDLDKMFTKDYKGDGVYVIYKNGEEVKTIEGEGNANAWINDEMKKLKESKKSLKENFVGIGMVGNIFDREKTDYEMAFEHFTKGSLSENEEVEEANLNEVKRFEFSFNYNTDEDDVKYIQNLLNKAGVDAMAKAGIDSEEIIVRAFSAKDLTKSKKAIVADGFEIND
jgi:hypothetical protein